MAMSTKLQVTKVKKQINWTSSKLNILVAGAWVIFYEAREPVYVGTSKYSPGTPNSELQGDLLNYKFQGIPGLWN